MILLRTLYTFGDSILDCARYNGYGVHPGALLVKNDDAMFPEFRGKDLATRGRARLEHRAVDGATIAGLPAQAQGVEPDRHGIALLTIGGNDLLTGLLADRGPGVESFRARLEHWLDRLPLRPVLVGNVYDPTFEDDARNFTGVDPALARANLRRVNGVLAEMGRRFGALVDVHAHFLRHGNASWYTGVIEPSLTGASEVRRAFLPEVLGWAESLS